MAAWQKSSPFPQRATPGEALKKAERFCAYQERSHQEVKRKLFDLGLYGADVDQVMAQLIEQNFLNEERFARSFARGKFRMKSWGKYRIERELKQRQISPYCIRAALTEIEDVEYQQALALLLRKRLGSLPTDLHAAALRQNLTQFAMRRGFEMELIYTELAKLLA